MRRELGGIHGPVDALIGNVQRIGRDRRESEDDVWIMLKTELMRQRGNFERWVQAQLDASEGRSPPTRPTQRPKDRARTMPTR
jgi:hypothetical protein